MSHKHAACHWQLVDFVVSAAILANLILCVVTMLSLSLHVQRAVHPIMTCERWVRNCSLSLSLATGCVVHIRWVASEFNAGDYGSRSPFSGTKFVAPQENTLDWQAVSPRDAHSGSSQSRGTSRCVWPSAEASSSSAVACPEIGEEDRTLRRLHPGPRHLKMSPKMLACGARQRAHAQSWLQARDSSRRGFLESHEVRAPTKAGYRQMPAKMAVHLFYWNIVLTMDIPSMTLEFKASLDEAMSDYCDFLYFEGEPGSLVSQVYSALGDHWPEVGKAGDCPLPRFFRARQAWRGLAPGRTRDPLPLLHLVVVIVSLIKSGHVSFAAACLLMWTCYFRPSEVLDVHAGDVLAPTSSCPHVSLLLPPFERGGPSKVGEYDDGVALDMEELILFGPWLLRQASRLAPEVKLFRFTYLEMVVMFREAMEEWDLADAVLYGMRHGGASHDIVSNQRSVLEVKKRGRWAKASR